MSPEALKTLYGRVKCKLVFRPGSPTPSTTSSVATMGLSPSTTRSVIAVQMLQPGFKSSQQQGDFPRAQPYKRPTALGA